MTDTFKNIASTGVCSVSPAQQHQTKTLGNTKSTENTVVVPAMAFEVGRVGLRKQLSFFNVGIRGVAKRVRECFLRRSEKSVVEKASLKDEVVQTEPSTQSVEEFEEDEQVCLAEFGMAADLARWKWSVPVVEVEIEEPVATLGSSSNITSSIAHGVEESLVEAAQCMDTGITSKVADEIEERLAALTSSIAFGVEESSAAITSEIQGTEEVFKVAPLVFSKRASATAAPGAEVVAPLGLRKKAISSAAHGAEECLVIAPLSLGLGKKKKKPLRSALRGTTATNRVVSKTVRFEDDSRPLAWGAWQYHAVFPFLADEPPNCRVGLSEVDLKHPSLCSGVVDGGRAWYEGEWRPFPGKPGYEARRTPPEINDEGTRAVIKVQSDAAREANRPKGPRAEYSETDDEDDLESEVGLSESDDTL
ncbi:hypothetical protein GLAREA_11815 [Glarea lozoyensis ATCC 20868]|uniref:Uncharacterized protein n=2 Tax=Glarea lozoyensis TaxID=101852 RepID=S3CJ27_GLAL2|nr:uncharacterized protein GLAREA_11815 [Glarea lozoyensis ATCC 20868]EHL01230.1 hypothetical protein M7I_2773 [Glarea lozoyensis 74030]EPE25234.1 hypothetical protein GLAREA_11815 [Glarea lozoyensis ATCC 20868]